MINVSIYYDIIKPIFKGNRVSYENVLKLFEGCDFKKLVIDVDDDMGMIVYKDIKGNVYKYIANIYTTITDNNLESNNPNTLTLSKDIECNVIYQGNLNQLGLYDHPRAISEFIAEKLSDDDYFKNRIRVTYKKKNKNGEDAINLINDLISRRNADRILNIYKNINKENTRTYT
jgi:hypothetical protein